MAILVYLESSGGKLKKPAFEAATYAVDLAAKLGTQAVGITTGITQEVAQTIGKYGLTKVLLVHQNDAGAVIPGAHGGMVAAAAQKLSAIHIVLPQTYTTRAFAPALSVRTGFSLLPGVTALPEVNGDEIRVTRTAYSGKAIQTMASTKPNVILIVKANSYSPKENAVTTQVEAFDFTPSEKDLRVKSLEVIRASDKIALTEADVVVSAGRGLKGPENWGMVETLAESIGAATACSKPVADVHWRPHHEHVGQTGIQIAPNVYIAIGISGAIQHLAGVNSSKTIVVINKDPEAPFFKAADFGIVGDAFEVVPALINEIKAHKAKH